MTSPAGWLAVVMLVFPPIRAAGRDDELFASWEEAQRSVTSLVVEFTLETQNRAFPGMRQVDGSLRLLRHEGKLYASYELREPPRDGRQPQRLSGLLHDTAVYLLVHQEKKAVRFDPSDGNLRQFLERHFNPFVRLLDRKRTEQNCHLQVTKQDDWYTYLAVTPNEVERSSWFCPAFKEGRAAFMNKRTDQIPMDMPRQFWFTDGNLELTFDIKSWRLNPAEGPKLEEFTKPEDRLGWEAGPWRRSGKKP